MAGNDDKASTVVIKRGKYPLFLIPKVVKDEIEKHKDKIRSVQIQRTGGHSFRVMTTVISERVKKDE